MSDEIDPFADKPADSSDEKPEVPPVDPNQDPPVESPSGNTEEKPEEKPKAKAKPAKKASNKPAKKVAKSTEDVTGFQAQLDRLQDKFEAENLELREKLNASQMQNLELSGRVKSMQEKLDKFDKPTMTQKEHAQSIRRARNFVYKMRRGSDPDAKKFYAVTFRTASFTVGPEKKRVKWINTKVAMWGKSKEELKSRLLANTEDIDRAQGGMRWVSKDRPFPVEFLTENELEAEEKKLRAARSTAA